MKSYSTYQFAVFRIILGLYLLQHFLFLIPYGSEVFSSEGIFPRSSLNFTHGIIPSVFDLNDSPLFINAVLWALSALSVCLILGFKRPWVALLLWLGWISLFGRNNLISNPGIPFIGWILLAMAVVPQGERLSLSKKNDQWQMPKMLFYGAWVIMALSYSISGFDKYMAPSWRNGTAMEHLLTNPLARDTPIRTFLLQSPDWFMHLKTWGILGLEMLFLPLAIWSRSRPYAWLSMVFMHLGILVVVDFADLTAGMLMIHLFTFDSQWLQSALTRRKANSKDERIVFFDGVCSICNTTVDFLMREDQEGVLKYASLQGETAQQYKEIPQNETPGSILYLRGKQFYEKSSAALLLLNDMGGFWKLLSFLRIIPKFIRNAVYDVIARNRYKWFGKKETCRMPTAAERNKMLN